MKATYKFILAAFAATVALSSCTKDIAADRQDTGSQDGLRKIAVSFGASTKTYLGEDGLTPKFEVDDAILISDGKTEPKIVKVQKKGEEVFFETNLKGNLKAVYPVDAAVFNQKTGDLSVKISSKQFGLFKDANIAMAYIGEKDNTATFENQTAVLKFYVGPEIDVTMLKIHAVDTVSYDWQLSSEGNTIWVECSGIPDSVRVCYVAVNPMYNPVKLEVQSFTTTQTKSPNDPVTRIFSSVSLERSDMVNVFIPYYIDVNGQKWAYCNVGAFLPEEPGLYFAWGSTEGHKLDGWYLENNYKFNRSDCPFIVNFEYESNITFNKYVTDQQYWGCEGSPDKKQTLDPDDDAARKAWGEPWRMPTEAEFKTLTETQDVTGTVNEYISFGPNGLILPLTGNGIDEGMTNIGIDGSYWSSELKTGNNDNAYYLYFSVGENGLKDMPGVHDTRRYYGYAIRPIYGQAQPAGNQTLPISVNPYTNGGTL